MKQTFNPEYGALLNAQREDFSIVTHVPMLPPPAPAFKSTICYLKSDGCFYRCIPLDGIWTWDKVTYGPLRQYVLGVCWITVEYVFDDEVNTIKAIIHELKRYGDYFADMEEGEHGVNLLTAVRKVNEIIKYINRVCGVELQYVDEGATLGDGDTCEELGAKLNKLISVLNPHAGAKLQHEKLATRIEALEQQAGTRDSFRPITADEKAAGPVAGTAYYVKSDEGEYIEQLSLTEFEADVEYFVSNLTPGELTARLTRLEATVAGHSQNFADLNVTFRDFKNNILPKLTADMAAVSEKVDAIETTTANIVSKYIGWPMRGNDERSVMERIIALEKSTGTSDKSLVELIERVNNLGTTLSGVQSNISVLIAEQKKRDEDQDTERAALAARNAKYEIAFRTIANLEISDDMTYSQVHDTVVAIVTACKAVVA